MAKRGKPSEPIRSPVELLTSREDAQARIESRIAKCNEIRSTLGHSPESYDTADKEYRLWNDYNKELLKRIFSTDEIAVEYSRYIGSVVMSMRPPSLGEKIRDLHELCEGKIERLKSILERLELIPVVGGAPNPPEDNNTIDSRAPSKQVFLVHGHDEAAKANLEIFLTEIGLEPIVLHRQADQGLTVIEKFEKYSDVGYAFILLTPDEVAYLISDDRKPDKDRKKELRARANVIFEFGYFIGRLGRSRTCCLYTGGVTLPSDISGMIYKKFDKSIEEIAYSIIKDLKAVGMCTNLT